MNTKIKLDGQKPLRLGNHISLLQGSCKGNEKTVIGIDPGSNFGFTIINRELVSIYYGKLPVDKRKGYQGINAYNYTLSLLNNIHVPNGQEWKAIVEGASYNDRFGQVALEERRFGFFFALYTLGYSVEILPPASVRKRATGSGKTTIGEWFPNLNHDAMDSLGCALAALCDMNETTLELI